MGAKDTVKVLGARPGAEVEVAPGQKDAPLPPENLERWGLVELIPQGDGSLRARVRPLARWQPLTRARLRELGIGASADTIRRLGDAGFIQVRRVSPAVTEFEVDSYLAHCARVQEDPWFWTADRVKRMRATWAGD